jgi:hypothetical protein
MAETLGGNIGSGQFLLQVPARCYAPSSPTQPGMNLPLDKRCADAGLGEKLKITKKYAKIS